MSPEQLMEFTHLLVEARSKYSLNLRPYTLSHEVLDVVEGFWHISFNYNKFPPIQIKTRPHIFILKRKENYPPVMPATSHEDVTKEASTSDEAVLDDNSDVVKKKKKSGKNKKSKAGNEPEPSLQASSEPEPSLQGSNEPFSLQNEEVEDIEIEITDEL